MTEHSISLENLAAKFDRQLPPDEDIRQALSSTPVFFAGYGSIARPMSAAIAARGARRMTIVDPKSYVERSAHSQCEPPEVGRAKVVVGAEQLGCLGSMPRAFHRDLFDIPDGIVERETLVVATVDNRRGDIGANRLASRMGARLLKINVEPDLSTVAVRAYDFRHGESLCAECQFSDRHYESQRHPRSCDGAADGRATNSPRWLSQTAAHLGLMAVIDLALDGKAASRWFGSEWQYRADLARSERSLLSSHADCRWDHSRRWLAVERIPQGPATVTLADLLGQHAGDFGSDARIRFCQSVALSGTCGECGRQTQLVRWTCDSNPRGAIATCRNCGGEIAAPGYWKFSELSPRHLQSVWDRPLADWGVESFAVISLQSGDRTVSFIINE